MRLWRTVGIVVPCVVASVAVTWAWDDYRMRLDLAQRSHRSLLDVADLEKAYSHLSPLPPVTERARFEHPLRVKALSGEEVCLDFSRGKHIVLFAGCTCIYVEGTAGRLAAMAHSHDAELSFILVSEVHPDSLPMAKSAKELEEYRACKVQKFLGPNVSVYFDIDQGAERSLEFTKLNLLYLEDGWQLYRMTPPGHEGRYQLGVGPFLSWWGAPMDITLDPTNVAHLWIVDNGTDRVYQCDNAATRTSGSQAASGYFALAAGNTNPQDIADPPTGGGVAASPMVGAARRKGAACQPLLSNRLISAQALDAAFAHLDLISAAAETNNKPRRR